MIPQLGVAGWTERGRVGVAGDPAFSVDRVHRRDCAYWMGATPLTDTVEGLAARLRMQRAGYRPVDTTMAPLEGKQQAELAVSLTPQATRASGGG